MVIYHYSEKIWIILVSPIFLYNMYNHEKYYPNEPVIMHIKPLITIIQEKIWVIATKKGKGKLPLFCGFGEHAIPIYGARALPWQHSVNLLLAHLP